LKPVQIKSIIYMKAIRFLLVLGAAAGLLFYEPTGEPSSIFILCALVLIFMFGMMKLSAKTPSKETEKSDDHV
jgi:hypothetical protein